MDELLEFQCKVLVEKYNTDDFKIYYCQIDKIKYPNIKTNNYATITLIGSMQELTTDTLYNVKAREEDSKYGTQYKVSCVKRDIPTSIMSSSVFLQEILTPNQAESLLNVYPNIIDKVIKNDLDDLDLNKVHGIKEKTFTKIKKKIIENFALIDLVEKFKGLISLQILRKLLAKYESTEKIIEMLKYKPYKCLVGLSRVGFKTADVILLEIDKLGVLRFNNNLLTSEDRMKACITYILEDNETNGNTKIKRDKLRRECEKLAPECIHHFSNVLSEDDKSIYYDVDSKFIALRKSYDIEKNISNIILEGLKYSNEFNIEYKQYIKDEDGNELTDQQELGLKNICKENISIINGYSGSGKSFTISKITKMLSDNKISFTLAAPTGKAVKVLESYTKRGASTIHRLLGLKPPNDCMFGHDCKLSQKVIIIDETSMIDIYLMEKLLEAIDFTKTKLLLVGDANQLPSVGAGNVFHDMINSNIIPITTLDKIFRYGEGGIDTVATKTRLSNEFLSNEKIQKFGKNGDYIFINCSNDGLLNYLDAIYKKLIFNKNYSTEDILVLSAYNKGDFGTKNINSRLQSIANPLVNEELGMVIGETTYYTNDSVIQTRNNYEAEIYDERYDDPFVESGSTLIANGESGKIIEIKQKEVIIQFDKYKIVYKKEDLLKNIMLAYCISVHRSQGSQSKHVIVITPSSHTYMLNSNLVYVAISRSQEQCYHIGSAYTINNVIKTKANFDRNTFLKEFLIR